MSYNITERAKDVISQKVLVPHLVVVIDGYPINLTTAVLSEIAKYGGEDLYYGKPGLVYGGSVRTKDQSDLISLDGTTTQITQQLMQDDGAASSTTQVTVALVNKDGIFNDLARPVGNNDIISKKATVYLGAEGMSFPDDYIRIFVGNVTDIQTPPGMVKLKISHPENQKRAELFQKIQTELVGDITNSDTTIDVISTEGMLLPADIFETYVRIGDEIIRYTGLTDTSLTGCTRAQLNTLAAAHEDGDSVDTFYVLGDATADSNAITMALKVLLSGAGEWVTDAKIESFGMSPEPATQNSIFFRGRKLEGYENIKAGDKITTTGASNPANNLTNATVTTIIDEYDGTRILVAETLVPEMVSPVDSASASFKSQFDTLPDGLAMTPDQVDIAEFLLTATLFSSSMPVYRIYLKDTISGKDLLNREILFPAACYSLPRKGQVSVGKTKPPIADYQTQILNETTVLNAKDLQIERSSLQDFYNAVVYQFEEDSIEDKFLAGRVTLSAASNNRIKVGNKPYKVISKGLRKQGDTEVIIQNNAQRILDRFQYGAEVIKGIKVSFSVGWSVEVGDTVIVEGLQLFDSKTGNNFLSPRIMEVTNRAFNFRQGIITLDLTDTAFAVDGRYGTLSPSSKVGVGSTSTEIMIVKSFGTTDLERERDKWASYVGLKVQIHSPDWTSEGIATFLGFSPANDNMMLLSPGLGFVPSENDIIDIAPYDDAGALYKALHCFANPHTLVLGPVVDQTQFHSDSPSVFFEGAIVVMHNADWSQTSKEVKVVDVVGSLVTVDTPLGYLPNIGDQVELIGFISDAGLPYRIL